MPSNNSLVPIVGIVGISSRIGQALAAELTEVYDHAVFGSFRKVKSSIREVSTLQERGGFALDVTDRIGRAEFMDAFLKAGNDRHATLVYCCGVWGSGPVQKMDDILINEMIEVGLTAPICLTSAFLRGRHNDMSRTQVVIITGMGGEKATGALVSVYSSVSNGIYSFVRSVGDELAGSGGRCWAAIPGLFDKGQEYITSLCSELPIKTPTPLSELTAFISKNIAHSSVILNGSVIELGGGFRGYGTTADWLARNRSR